MIKVLKDNYRKTFNYTGVSKLSEFWLFLFGNLILAIVINIVAALIITVILLTTDATIIHFIVSLIVRWIVFTIFLIIFTLAMLALLIRRFRDAGLSPLLLLLILIPAIGHLIILGIAGFMPSKKD